MDKNKILRTYIEKMDKDIDSLREEYPKARAEAILDMEKGFRYCGRKTVEWIDIILTMVEQSNQVPPFYAVPSGGPLVQSIDKNITHTNYLSVEEPLKKKKPFLQLVSEGFKDMGKDVFEANQLSLKKEDKYK